MLFDSKFVIMLLNIKVNIFHNFTTDAGEGHWLIVGGNLSAFLNKEQINFFSTLTVLNID